MKCDSRASLLAHTFASLCLGCEPKARVMTYKVSLFMPIVVKNIYGYNLNMKTIVKKLFVIMC
jgi:hypothetical protein